MSQTGQSRRCGSSLGQTSPNSGGTRAVVELLIIIAVFLLTYYNASLPRPIQFIIWFVLGLAVLLLVLPWLGLSIPRRPGLY